MQIDQEIRYFEEWSSLWRKGRILKIAKTGNVRIRYETERVWNGGMDDTIRSKWVKPTESKHEGFMIVEDLPKKPFIPKEIVKSCNNCEHRSDLSGCSNYVEGNKYISGYDENCSWVEYIGYDDGSTQDISDEAWKKFVYGEDAI